MRLASLARQPPHHVRLGKSPHHQPAHRHPLKKSRKAKPALPTQNNMVTSSSGNKLYTLYHTKVLSRPRRFSDLSQDNRCVHITSHSETLRNLCHVVSGTRIFSHPGQVTFKFTQRDPSTFARDDGESLTALHRRHDRDH